MQIATVGIDLRKATFHVVGLDEKGAIVLGKRFSPTQLLNQLANMPACLIGMEACCGSSFSGKSPKCRCQFMS